jgi:type II secretory pathway pseudopilin PulG
LVEILVSVLIISIGLVSAIFLQVMSIKHGTRADNLTVASILAESEIERLKTYASYNEIPGGVASGVESLTREGLPSGSADGQCFFRTTEIASQRPTNRSHTVKVTVSWTGASGADSVTYEAILTDINLGNSGAI